jgi:hypothetical protein
LDEVGGGLTPPVAVTLIVAVTWVKIEAAVFEGPLLARMLAYPDYRDKRLNAFHSGDYQIGRAIE